VLRFLLQLLGILVLAVMVSAAWLYREQLVRMVRHSPEEGPVGHPNPTALARAHDRVDSLNGWHADSVLLSASEMASLLEAGLPREVRSHIESLSVTLGENRLELSGKLDTSVIPRDQLGPFAGALKPWEPIAAAGSVSGSKPGYADWTVDHLTLRGFELPEAVSRNIASRVLGGSREGMIRIPLPSGIGGLRVRPAGVALYRVERQ
jgi:hypothetical protein